MFFSLCPKLLAEAGAAQGASAVRCPVLRSTPRLWETPQADSRLASPSVCPPARLEPGLPELRAPPCLQWRPGGQVAGGSPLSSLTGEADSHATFCRISTRAPRRLTLSLQPTGVPGVSPRPFQRAPRRRARLPTLSFLPKSVGTAQPLPSLCRSQSLLWAPGGGFRRGWTRTRIYRPGLTGRLPWVPTN